MKLSELVKNLTDKNIKGNPDIPINGIAYDSRKVGKDYIFAAISGHRLDGRNFVNDAVNKGASALLAENAVPDAALTQIIVPDVREALALISSSFYGAPSARMTLLGVTGTNGKTTTTYLVESILRAAGFKVGVVGTINYRYNDKIFDASHTTPEASDLQRILKEMIDNGVTHCIMEVSSHALSQKRVYGSRFIGGVFTNLTQDHLDYHRTMEAYFESKSRLFTDFINREKNGFAVINMDDPWGLKLKTQNLATASSEHGAKLKTIGYGMNSNAEIKAAKAAFSEKGIEAEIHTPIGPIEISSPLLGEYNLQNIMAAAGLGIGLELDIEIIREGIANLKRVPGRIERIVSEHGFQAAVDYAHTGDALERVLCALRPLTKGRLITVFGCGGDRDRGKRPIMGEIATRLSDFTIITSDNPRTEDPLEIIKEIEQGVRGQGARGKKTFISELRTPNSELNGYAVIPDRHEAIRAAVDMAVSGDIILVAGKGHEDYQIIGEKKFHFDDTEEIKKAMKERSNNKKT